MNFKKDSWTKPYGLADGRFVYGAAAREARIKRAGGIDNIVAKAVCYALTLAENERAEETQSAQVIPFKERRQA